MAISKEEMVTFTSVTPQLTRIAEGMIPPGYGILFLFTKGSEAFSGGTMTQQQQIYHLQKIVQLLKAEVKKNGAS